MSAFDWFPDWRGQTCIIVASGPSAKGANLEAARGIAKVIVINSSWQLAPWADVLYGCDYSWWNANSGVKAFAGLKVSQDKQCSVKYPNIHLIATKRGHNDIITEPRGTVAWGGNSGMHALNLAAQFGPPAKIILVGYDMRLDHGLHWHGKHPKGLNNPRQDHVVKWRKVVDGAAKPLRNLGITVVNASEISALTAYPKMSLEEALNHQG